MTKAHLQEALLEMGRAARGAGRRLALMPAAQKNLALEKMAGALTAHQAAILAANAEDMAAATANGLSAAMLDRLLLTPQRIADMARGLRELMALPDPVGRLDSATTRPNGLEISKIRVPIGVIAIIYESRPNVTVDAAGICLKAGNATILRGGSESIRSNLALAAAMFDGLRAAGLPETAVQVMPWTDREAVMHLLKLDRYVDLVIPRGGEGLIRTVVENSRIPVIKHYKGVCHVYVDRAADPAKALAIIENAKCQRPGVCNAAEKVLLHREIAAEFAPALAEMFRRRKVEMRGDEAFCKLVPDARPAKVADWDEEYLDLIITVAVVDSLGAAVSHIAEHSSAHSDAIVTDDQQAARAFTEQVDSAAVYVNASTRFTDGGQFGMGAEIGISTDRIHARGPMGLEELTTYKYVVQGNGQVR